MTLKYLNNYTYYVIINKIQYNLLKGEASWIRINLILSDFVWKELPKR